MRPATIFDYLPIGIWLTPQQAIEIMEETKGALEFLVLLSRAHPGSMSVN